MEQSEESFFEEALNRYKADSPAEELLEDFQKIASTTPNNADTPTPYSPVLLKEWLPDSTDVYKAVKKVLYLK